MEPSGIPPREDLRLLPHYAPGRSVASVRHEFGIDRVIKLASNENPLGMGARARQAFRHAAAQGHVYPDGIAGGLLGVLSRHWDWPVEGLFAGNGSDEVFVLFARAFLAPGDVALVSEHTFSEYAFATLLAGATLRVVPMDGIRYDLHAMADLAPQVRAVFVCNPNNPTGTAHGHRSMEGFLARVPASTLVVLDEAYAEYAHTDPVRSRELLARHPNLIVTRTFSKLHGLAALRVGYLVARPDVVQAVLRTKTPFNLNGPAQAAAAAALLDQVHVARSLRANARGRRRLLRGLRGLGLDPQPTEANFVFCRVPMEAAWVARECMRRGVIVRPLASFGLPDAIRITVGKPGEIDLCLAVLGEVLCVSSKAVT